MTILADHQIVNLCNGEKGPMIRPFVDELMRTNHGSQKIISWGLSSYGYDIRLGRKFMVANSNSRTVDPKNNDISSWKEVETKEGESIICPAGSFVLAESIERFYMPHDVIGIVIGKSTYARCGLIVNVTPIEPGWVGILTLELHNASHHDIVLYPLEGIAQVNFHQGELPDVTYGQRGGKYQNAEKVTPAKV